MHLTPPFCPRLFWYVQPLSFLNLFPFDFPTHAVPSISPARSQNRPTSGGRTPKCYRKRMFRPFPLSHPRRPGTTMAPAQIPSNSASAKRSLAAASKIPFAPGPSPNPGSAATEPPHETCTHLILIYDTLLVANSMIRALQPLYLTISEGHN